MHILAIIIQVKLKTLSYHTYDVALYCGTVRLLFLRVSPKLRLIFGKRDLTYGNSSSPESCTSTTASGKGHWVKTIGMVRCRKENVQAIGQFRTDVCKDKDMKGGVL